jgi:hypothetical protein
MLDTIDTVRDGKDATETTAVLAVKSVAIVASDRIMHAIERAASALVEESRKQDESVWSVQLVGCQSLKRFLMIVQGAYL